MQALWWNRNKLDLFAFIPSGIKYTRGKIYSQLVRAPKVYIPELYLIFITLKSPCEIVVIFVAPSFASFSRRLMTAGVSDAVDAGL